MSGQNRSSAVMQQRAEPNDSLDDFPTPPWAMRALLEILQARGWSFAGKTCREPAANRGYMVRALREYFGEVEAADVFDYGAGFPVRDYLWGLDPDPVDWTFTNPPYRLGDQFVERMLATSQIGCGVIVRSAFLEGERRYEDLFAPHPPTFVLQFVERVVMHKGVLRRTGAKYLDGDGKEKTASTATAYSWLVWIKGAERQPFDWIPPCRMRLERDGDYPPEPSPVVHPDDFGLFAVENFTGGVN